MQWKRRSKQKKKKTEPLASNWLSLVTQAMIRERLSFFSFFFILVIAHLAIVLTSLSPRKVHAFILFIAHEIKDTDFNPILTIQCSG